MDYLTKAKFEFLVKHGYAIKKIEEGEINYYITKKGQTFLGFKKEED